MAIHYQLLQYIHTLSPVDLVLYSALMLFGCLFNFCFQRSRCDQQFFLGLLSAFFTSH